MTFSTDSIVIHDMKIRPNISTVSIETYNKTNTNQIYDLTNWRKIFSISKP